MTDTPPPTKTTGPTVLIVTAAVVGTVVIACITLMAIAIEDGARATAMIASVGGTLATLLAFFGLFINVRDLRSDVSQVKQQTTELTNGLGDSKTRAAVADVLRPELVDPAVQEQLAVDYQRRARSRASAVEAAARLVEPHAYPERTDLD